MTNPCILTICCLERFNDRSNRSKPFFYRIELEDQFRA
jgi:hypothetical protein